MEGPILIVLWIAALGCVIGTHFPMRRLNEAGRANRVLEMEPEQDRLVVCLRCSYPLAGLAKGTKCPECGSAKVRNMRAGGEYVNTVGAVAVVLGAVVAQLVAAAVCLEPGGVLFLAPWVGAATFLSSVQVVVVYPYVEFRRMLVVLAGLLLPQVLAFSAGAVLVLEGEDPLDALALVIGPFLVSIPLGLCGAFVGAHIADGMEAAEARAAEQAAAESAATPRTDSAANEGTTARERAAAGGDGHDSRAGQG